MTCVGRPEKAMLLPPGSVETLTLGEAGCCGRSLHSRTAVLKGLLEVVRSTAPGKLPDRSQHHMLAVWQTIQDVYFSGEGSFS